MPKHLELDAAISFSDEELDVPDHYEDEDEETEDGVEYTLSRPDARCVLHDRFPMQYLVVSVHNYDFKTWPKMFPKGVDLLKLIVHGCWKQFLIEFSVKKEFEEIEHMLESAIREGINIVPYPELMFNAMNVLKLDKVKVVVMGQDPYINGFKFKGKWVPQAMGMSFSVPRGYNRPPSLINVYQNMIKFGHLKEMPKTGCLAFWAAQGCLMINAALTTVEKTSGAHNNVWAKFTEALIDYISDNCNNVAFIVWGAKANGACKNVDTNKHFVTTSSHPSPHSFTKKMNGVVYGMQKENTTRKMQEYEAFADVDHFGNVNNYFDSVGKSRIMWDQIA